MTERVHTVYGVKLYALSADAFDGEPAPGGVEAVPTTAAPGIPMPDRTEAVPMPIEVNVTAPDEEMVSVPTATGVFVPSWKMTGLPRPSLRRGGTGQRPHPQRDVNHSSARVLSEAARRAVQRRDPRQAAEPLVLAAYLAASAQRTARSAKRYATVGILHEHLIDVLQQRLNILARTPKAEPVTPAVLDREARTALRELEGKVLKRIAAIRLASPSSDDGPVRREAVPVAFNGGPSVTFFVEVHPPNRDGRGEQLHVSGARIG